MANQTKSYTPPAIETTASGALPEGVRKEKEEVASKGADAVPSIPSEVSAKADRSRFRAPIW